MKQTIRYTFLTIPGKLRGDIRLVVDSERSPEYSGTTPDGSITNSLTIYPALSLSIIRVPDMDENGQRVRAPWNPNDYLPMTKFNLPIMIDELKGMIEDLKTPELYTYHGTRLEINEGAADKIRRPFMIGNNTVELSAVIVMKDDERLEGVKLKFNNEQSSVTLTLNELTSLCYNLDHIDIDSMSLTLYCNWLKGAVGVAGTGGNDTRRNTNVDIMPKERSFQSDFV